MRNLHLRRGGALQLRVVLELVGVPEFGDAGLKVFDLLLVLGGVFCLALDAGAEVAKAIRGDRDETKVYISKQNI